MQWLNNEKAPLFLVVWYFTRTIEWKWMDFQLTKAETIHRYALLFIEAIVLHLNKKLRNSSYLKMCFMFWFPTDCFISGLVSKPSRQVPKDGAAEPAEPVEQQREGRQLGLGVDLLQLTQGRIAEHERQVGRHRHKEGEHASHEKFFRSGLGR